MASGSPRTGGSRKIRTRRCHPGPVTPYSQGRRHQLGILSRVTEYVQNNVPAWLQRYFDKNEDVCSHTTDAEETPCSQENREDDEIVCAGEESSNINDGRTTSEPTVGNTEDASTISPASNYAGELNRPSLRRSCSNFSMLESHVSNCEPSTSSAFPTGSPGFSLVKEIIDSTSQHGAGNKSTSHHFDFSSRVSDKAMAAPKKTSVPPLWSPEAERSHSLSQHTATRPKKPAFSLSAFGTLSPSFEKSLIFQTSQHGDPPCYPRKTTYGGAAAAVRHSKLATTPCQAPVRRQMKAKQLNAQSCGVTSLAARRILQSLEKLSGPLADVLSFPVCSPLDRSRIDNTDLGAKRDKVDSQYPVQKLMSPKLVSRATTQSVYFKPSLTPSHELRKADQRIVKQHSTHYENSVTPGQNREQESGFPHQNLRFPAPDGLSSGAGSRGGKVRRERTHFLTSEPPVEEERQALLLSKISLPITNSSLPSFSFHCPLMTTSSPAPMSPSQSVSDKVQMISLSSTGRPVSRFSSSTVKSAEAGALPSSSAEFTFSMPVAKAELADTSSTSEPMISASAQDTTAVTSRSHKRKLDEDDEGPSRPAKTWKGGRVLDVLKNPGFLSPKVDAFAAQPTTTSPAVYTGPAVCRFSSSGTGLRGSLKAGSSWHCDTCLLPNKVTDDKCVACQAAKLPPRGSVEQTAVGTARKSGKPTISASGAGFGDKLKPEFRTWECDACLVQNKAEARKCIACETAKPGNGVNRFLPLPVVSESDTTMTASSSSCTVTTGTLGCADELKTPRGSWECPICSVSNNAEDNKCMSCMSKKTESSVPASSSSTASVTLSSADTLGLEKLNPEGSWDCEVCLVQNRADSAKCAACESAKPGTTDTKFEFKGIVSCSSRSNPAASCFKLGNPSPASGPSPTSTSTGDFQFRDQGGFKTSMSSESGSTDAMNRSFQLEKSTAIPRKVASEVISFGISVINHDPAAATTAATSQSGVSCRTVETKIVSMAPVTCQTSDVEREELPPAGGGSASGNMGSASVPPASAFTLGGTGEKQQQHVTSAAPAYGTKTDNEDRKWKARFPFGCSKRRREESSKRRREESCSKRRKAESCSQLAFGFNMRKPSEKASEQPGKATFASGAQTNTAADQGTAKAVFSFLNNSSCGSRTSASLAGGGIFANSTPSSNLPVAAGALGQASSPVISPALGNFAGPSSSQSLQFSQHNSTGTAVAPIVSGPGAVSNNTSTSGFSSQATTSSSSGGSFVFGTGPSTPSASPAFGANQTPTFGQSHGASQPYATALFATGSQPAPPPIFGAASSGNQPAVFGQQPSQRALGSGATPNSSQMDELCSFFQRVHFVDSQKKTAVKRKK
ncbi:nuclear pore complex protein Nup153-like [Choloepus didactylus]|uniref:nuclear pore complex protein Nup153-like n=1 Tax=Choloepus didactylus TaxID=27675 RepID=UPI00189C9972|nr:nuclear pore complex protein Nup153-like [Choloepus didactylus]